MVTFPSKNVSLRHFIQQVSCNIQATAFCIHFKNESCTNDITIRCDHKRSITSLTDTLMDPIPNINVSSNISICFNFIFHYATMNTISTMLIRNNRSFWNKFPIWFFCILDLQIQLWLLHAHYKYIEAIWNVCFLINFGLF